MRRGQNFATMSVMSTSSRQAGSVNASLLGIIGLAVALVAVAGFAVWAFMGRQDYKNNVDKKISAAAELAAKQTEATDAVKYAEEAKNPLKTYVGPSNYGSVKLQYPKTWSAYVVEKSSGSQPVDAYFQPDVVPDVGKDGNSFALRLQISSQSYDKAVAAYQARIKTGKSKAKPFALAKVPNVVGTFVEGELADRKQGQLLILPLRNLTLQIWTEGDGHLADFNNIILSNLSFSP